jgi:hypothetical protein
VIGQCSALLVDEDQVQRATRLVERLASGRALRIRRRVAEQLGDTHQLADALEGCASRLCSARLGSEQPGVASPPSAKSSSAP